MLKKCSYCVLIMTLVALNVGMAQTAATAVWPLTSDQNPQVTGAISAQPQRLTMMQVSYSSGVQRSSPSGTAGSWPGESTENSSRFMEFVVTPAQGNTFTITSISMILYANSGSNMRANVYYATDSLFASKVQIGSTFSLGSSALSTPNVTASLNLTLNLSETLYVRVYPWYTTSTTGKYLIVKSVTIAGTTLPSTAIIVNPTSLSGFIQRSSTEPSDVKTYSLYGINLTHDVAITPPSSFQISSDGGNTWWNDEIRLSVANGIIIDQPKTVSVRLNAASSGSYTGTISHTSDGAAVAYVSLDGVLLAPEPTVPSSLATDEISGNTVKLTFVGGNGSNRIVAICQGNALSWAPSDGAPISGVDANYSSAVDQGNGTKVVYDGNGTSVTVSGLSGNTTYTVGVFEYNKSTGNSQNYLTSNYPTSTFTTLTVATLNATPSSLAFGNVVLGQSSVKSYQLSGSYLASDGTITVTAPSGFQVSLSEAGSYSSSLIIPYSQQTLASTTVYVRFAPDEVKNYSDVISNNGGGTNINVPVTGKGISDQFQILDTPVGFATLNGSTTGGLNGTTVTITDPQQLADILKARENKSTAPLIVYISGTLSGYSTELSVKRTANISILGLGTNAGFNGFGMKIVECNNIIVRNLTFSDCHVDEKDGLAVDGSYNVWVDHCTFTDSPASDPNGNSHDGLLDVKNGSYNVTISYNHFMNHRKTCLLGHTESQTSDTVMKVTYYRNWFDGTYSRHPRIRYAKAHIVNNLYTSNGGYGVGVTCNAQVYLEENYFENVVSPVLISQVNDPEGTLSGDPAGYIKSVGNVTVNSGAILENLSGFNFNPSDYYSLEVAAGSNVKSLVQANAGAGLLDFLNEVQGTESIAPVGFALLQNYPNPFNPSTTIHYSIRNSGIVTIKIFDMIGREVAQLVNQFHAPGSYSIQWNAEKQPTGVYCVVLQQGVDRAVRKILLLK